MTTYTTLLGLWQGVPGDPAIRNAWGVPLNTNDVLIEQAITGDNGYGGGAGGINIAGLTTYALTIANGTTDQARQFLYPFVGALTGTCTVTIASTVKFGWALNATTGGHNVILTSGGGTQATLPPDGAMRFFYSDGTGNVTFPTVSFGGFIFAGALTVSSLTVTTGGISITLGGLTVSAGGAAVTGDSTITGKLTVTDKLTPSSGIVGVSTNTNAAAGLVGQYISSTVLSAAAVPLTDSATADVTSIDLTAGDWDVWGNVAFITGGFSGTLIVAAGTGETSATFDTNPAGGGVTNATVSNLISLFDIVIPAGFRRYSLSGTTTIYLLAEIILPPTASFAYGFIGARRVR